MNRIEKALFVFTLIGLGYSGQAITDENRYDTIIDRNIFRLNPQPIITASSNVEPVLDRKVDLSGISNEAGRKKAWFVVSPKPGSKDLPLYLNLSEGERQDFLEVVSITEQQGEVKVMNAGNSMVLSLKTNSLKAQPIAPIPAAPIARPVANTGIPAPAPQPVTASYSGETASYGNRSAVTVSGGTPTDSAMGGQTVEGSGLRTIPTRTLRLAPVANQSTATANQPPVDPLTQRVMMEVDNQDLQRRGMPAPPLP